MSSSDVLSQRCKSSNSSSFENSNLPNLTRYSAEMQSKSECAQRTSELFLFVLTKIHPPGDLEGPEQANASQDGEAERLHHLDVGEDELEEGGVHHEEVEAVEEADEVALQAQRVHLQDHLAGEKDNKEQVGQILQVFR